MSSTEYKLRPGFWMTGTAWLDNDGRHIWFAHDCTTERVATMLPWPTWHSDGMNVVPSISCSDCGLHAHYQFDRPPDETHRCMETWPHDGRWCELPKDHTTAHRAGTVEWAEYAR